MASLRIFQSFTSLPSTVYLTLFQAVVTELVCSQATPQQSLCGHSGTKSVTARAWQLLLGTQDLHSPTSQRGHQLWDQAGEAPTQEQVGTETTFENKS